MEKAKVIENLNALFKQRAEFYEFFDANIKKLPNSDVFDFKESKFLSAQEVYTHFYHYDYAIRKLLPKLYKAYEIKDEDLNRDF